MKRILAVFIGLVLMVNIYGCIALLAGTAGGAGTAVWLSGKLTQQVNAPYERSISAAKSAMNSLKLEITKETKSDDITQINGKYTDGREIWIDVRPVTEASSRIDVRVGAAGDKAAANKILKRIVSYL